jgi:hypothetical protein
MKRGILIVAALVVSQSARAQTPQVQSAVQQVAAMYAPGQVPASQVFAGAAPTGVEVPFFVALQPGRCYTFVGAVGPGVEQLSIYLFDPSGRTVAKDTTDRSITPHLTHCARWPGQYKILGKIKRGQGELAIQAFTQGAAPPPVAPAPVAPPPPATTVLPPIQQPAVPPQPPPPPGYTTGAPPPQSPLAAQLRQLGAQYAPGQVPASGVYGGFAQTGVEMPFMVELQAGRCYTFVGTVGAGVEQLSIYLFDPTGRTVVKDTTDRAIAPRMTHCARWPGFYKLLGKVKRGQGEFAIQAFTPAG